MLLTILAFVAALSILIVVHEYGHYRVAVACGVKVLRFSLGFGKPLFSWKLGKDQTEFVIAPIPLGGYVRMLDEREGPVDPKEQHRAFNRQPLRSRFLIVLAGPMANLVLAVLLFACTAYAGLEEEKAVLAQPVANSMLQVAGVRSGDLVTGIVRGQGDVQKVLSMTDLSMELIGAAFSQADVELELKRQSGEAAVAVLPLSHLGSKNVDATLMSQIGFAGVLGAPMILEVYPDSAALRAGLQGGDIVRSINGDVIADRDVLMASIRSGSLDVPDRWVVERNGSLVSLQVLPDRYDDNGVTVGRIGVSLGVSKEMVTIRYGVWSSLNYGLRTTWKFSTLTLELMGKMLVGKASVQNLSGPLTIAQVAGKAAHRGWIDYIFFLGIISLSLGVLNLLPLPVLDGGHLVYYAYEAIRGKPVSEKWMVNFQKVGVLLLLLLMFIATFNDIVRLTGQ